MSSCVTPQCLAAHWASYSRGNGGFRRQHFAKGSCHLISGPGPPDDKPTLALRQPQCIHGSPEQGNQGQWRVKGTVHSRDHGTTCCRYSTPPLPKHQTCPLAFQTKLGQHILWERPTPLFCICPALMLALWRQYWKSLSKRVNE